MYSNIKAKSVHIRSDKSQKHLRWLLCSLLFFSNTVTAQSKLDVALPTPPAGFEWLHIAELNAVFLHPNGWFYTNNKGKLLSSFVIAKEAPAIGQHFTTGLTVSAINNLTKTGAQTLQQQIIQFSASSANDPKHELLAQQTIHHQGSSGIRILYQHIDTQQKYLKLYLARKNDQLLILTFESPRSQWQETAPIGHVLLKQFILLDSL